MTVTSCHQLSTDGEMVPREDSTTGQRHRSSRRRRPSTAEGTSRPKRSNLYTAIPKRWVTAAFRLVFFMSRTWRINLLEQENKHLCCSCSCSCSCSCHRVR